MVDTETTAIMWVLDDGGRVKNGYRGHAPGDCAARAAAIASGRPYKEIYDRIINLARLERPGTTRVRSHPREGVHKRTMQRLMEELGATWTPTMTIGSGCTDTRVDARATDGSAGAVVDAALLRVHRPSGLRPLRPVARRDPLCIWFLDVPQR